MSTRDNYERFMRELEAIAKAVGDVNVAGIAPGLCGDLRTITRLVVTLKAKARFIGGRECECEHERSVDEQGTPRCIGCGEVMP